MRFTTETLIPEYEPPLCHFGLISAPLAGFLAGGLEAGLGVGEATAGILGGVGSGALLGAGGGAALSGITGGNPLTGALTGALTGGAVGGAGAAGLGTIGEVGAGAVAGAAGSALTGQDILTGALGGGASGLAAGLAGVGGAGAGASGGTTVASMPGAGGAASAAGSAPPSVTPGVTTGVSPVPTDLTSSLSTDFGLATGTTGDAPFGSAPAFSGGASTPAATGATAGGAAGGGGGLNDIMGTFKNVAPLLGAGVLGMNLLNANKPLPGEQAVQQAAGEAGTMGRTLAAYQLSGTLPPGLQAVVDQGSHAAEAAARSKFAEMGLAGSTMEAEQIGQLKQARAAQVAQIADSLAKQGMDWSKLSANEFNVLLDAQMKQDTAFQNALASFARGLGGVGNVNLGGGTSSTAATTTPVV